MGAATCFELLQEIDRELPEHKTATPSAHEFAWTVKQAIEALLAANDRDPWGFSSHNL